MLKCNHIENFSILLIDKDKEFSSKLSIHLKQYGYKVIQAHSSKVGLKKAKLHNDELNLIILNIDLNSDKENDLFEQLQDISDTKVIILSTEDIGSKRESYFKKGVVDYFIISSKVHHISDDIHNAILSLHSNQEEKILVIESSKSISGMLKKILEKRSYQVLTANTAQDGLAILRDTQITVLILDMELPDIHGLKVLEGLRDLYLLNEFYVLAISSRNDPSLVRDALKGGQETF